MSIWIAGSAVVGSIGGALIAGKGAKDAAKISADATEESIAFDREKYQDWKDTYGGLEENLATYYEGLTPDFYEAQGLEAFEKEQEIARENIRTTFAQRGISDSGIAAAADIALETGGAERRATIRAQAPGLAAEEQRQFLQIGLGQNPGESVSRNLANQAQAARTESISAQRAAGEAAGEAVKTTATALGDYMANRNKATGEA